MLCGNFVYYPDINKPTEITYSVSPKINGKYFGKNLFCDLNLWTADFPNFKMDIKKNVNQIFHK